MGLGFNLSVAPPRDHGVPISEVKGIGTGMEHGGMEEQGMQWSYENQYSEGRAWNREGRAWNREGQAWNREGRAGSYGVPKMELRFEVRMDMQ